MPDPPRSQRSYVLGIDLGTTYSAAATVSGPPPTAVVEICVLGTIAAQIPTVVVHRQDGEILTGEAAERRAATEPTRTAREFKRRLGDPVPIIVGGVPYGAEALMAEMLDAIVRQVTDREGQAPTTIVLTHPANYTEYKRGLLLEAARLAGVDLARVRLITEPAAAAVAYAQQQRIEPGEIVAVYDLGGGTFDAAVVRRAVVGSETTFELLGTPEGMERLGGIDFDQAVLAHVDAVLDGMVSSADSSDPQVLAGQARLRDECRRAKEALSNDTDATIPVSLPGVQTEVRLTRDELEEMVRPRIAETVRALQRTIASAGITVADVSRVLLVGGSSRMPIVAQIIREALGRSVSADADPKLAIAIGAALSSVPISRASADSEPDPVRTSVAATPVARVRGSRRPIIIASAAAAALVAAALVVMATRDDSPTTAAPSTSAASTAVAAVPVTQAATTIATSPSDVDTVPPAVTAPADGVVERLAFDGTIGGTGIPGPPLEAGAPAAITGVAVAPDEEIYVASAGARVVKVAELVQVVADLGAGQVPTAGITVASDGSVFVSTPAGVVRIVDGIGELILDSAAEGLTPTLGPLALDGGGNLYVADNGSFRIIRRAADGSLTLVAGTGRQAAAGSQVVDGVAAVSTDLGVTTGLVVDGAGNLLIADGDLKRVRAVAADGTMATRAGGGTLDLTTATSATDVAFGSVDGVVVDHQQRIYVADAARHEIVRIGSDGIANAIAVDVPVTSLAITRAGKLIISDGMTLWTVGPVDAG